MIDCFRNFYHAFNVFPKIIKTQYKLRIVGIGITLLFFIASVAFTEEGTALTVTDQIQVNFPVSPSITEAEFSEIQVAAVLGDSDSQLYLGIFYFNGDMVEQDIAQAVHFYKLAAQQGNATAQRNLATLFDVGVGLPVNQREAFKWYSAAAAQNEPGAHLGIAGLLLLNQHSGFRKQFLWPVSEQLETSWALYRGGYKEWILKAMMLLTQQKESIGVSVMDFWSRYTLRKKYFQNQGVLVDIIRSRAAAGDPNAFLSLAKLHIDMIILNPSPHSTRLKISQFDATY